MNTFCHNDIADKVEWNIVSIREYILRPACTAWRCSREARNKIVGKAPWYTISETARTRSLFDTMLARTGLDSVRICTADKAPGRNVFYRGYMFRWDRTDSDCKRDQLQWLRKMPEKKKGNTEFPNEIQFDQMMS